jgi:hypothetical protein
MKCDMKESIAAKPGQANSSNTWAAMAPAGNQRTAAGTCLSEGRDVSRTTLRVLDRFGASSAGDGVLALDEATCVLTGRNVRNHDIAHEGTKKRDS